MSRDLMIVQSSNLSLLRSLKNNHKIIRTFTALICEELDDARSVFDRHCGTVRVVVTEDESWIKELEGFQGLTKVHYTGDSVEELLRAPALLWVL